MKLRCSLLDLNVYDTHDGIGIFGDLRGSVETLTSWGEWNSYYNGVDTVCDASLVPCHRAEEWCGVKVSMKNFVEIFNARVLKCRWKFPLSFTSDEMLKRDSRTTNG